MAPLFIILKVNHVKNYNKLALCVLGLTAAGAANASYPTYIVPVENSTTTLSVPQQADTSRGGLYVGIGGGALYFNNEVTVSGDGTLDGTTTSNSYTPTSGNNTAINGVLTLGYAWAFQNRLFFGIEGFGNITNAEVEQSATSTKNNTTVSTDIDMTWNNAYGARILPGFQVSPNYTIYGIFGYSRGNASLSDPTSTTTINRGGESISVTSTKDTGFGTDYGFNGYQLGLGSMYYLNQHVALRADVIYTGYEDQTLSDQTQTFPDGSSVETSTSVKPYTVEGDLSIVFLFN